jgi:hypothetical protein
MCHPKTLTYLEPKLLERRLKSRQCSQVHIVEMININGVVLEEDGPCGEKHCPELDWDDGMTHFHIST